MTQKKVQLLAILWHSMFGVFYTFLSPGLQDGLPVAAAWQFKLTANTRHGIELR